MSLLLDRRQFILGTSATLASSLLFSAKAAATPPPYKLIGFIKPFQKLPYAQISDIATEIGWDGIECPVRKGGTIEPPQVEEELPELVAALRKNKLELPVISTDVENAMDPLTQTVLRTAAKLGITRYRLKHFYYDLAKPIAPQVQRFKAQVRDLAQLNADLRIQGTIQNHSGKNYVGAPVWDLWELVKDLDPKQMAIYFDIGHATLEGGNCWPLHAKLVEPSLAVVSVKDFIWHNRPNAAHKNDWRAEWCPLGEGMVRGEFFDLLKKTGFNGPISQHFEYDLGAGQEMIAAMKKDLAALKRWLAP